jgi:hypothetical protein
MKLLSIDVKPVGVHGPLVEEGLYEGSPYRVYRDEPLSLWHVQIGKSPTYVFHDKLVGQGGRRGDCIELCLARAAKETSK